MLNPTHRATLRLMYTLAAEDRHANLALIAAELQLSCVEVDRVLVELDRAGLVDADRVRLTLAGLAFAVSARAPSARRANGRDPRRSASRAA
jgi:Mn-dependent DtxR family transcriptional regulator